MLATDTTRWVVRVAAATGAAATLAGLWVPVSPLEVGLTAWVGIAARWIPGTTVIFAQQSVPISFRFLPLLGGLALVVVVVTSFWTIPGRSRTAGRLWLMSAACLVVSSATWDLWPLPTGGVRVIVIPLCILFGASLALLSWGRSRTSEGPARERVQLWIWTGGGLLVALFVTLPLGVLLIASALTAAVVSPLSRAMASHSR